MPRIDLPPAVVADMQRHHGLITRRRLVTYHRIPPRRVDWWLQHGVLAAVHRAIYRRAGGFVPPGQAQLAAIWCCGGDAVAGPRASLRMWGATSLESGPLAVAVGAERSLRPKPFIVHTIQMDARDRGTVDATPVLQVPRALIAVAGGMAEDPLRRLIDDLRRVRVLHLGMVAHRCGQMPDHHVARRLLRIIASPEMAQENDGERALAVALAGLEPQPEWQVGDLIPGRRLDACWREALYALELDGRDHHVLPTDRDADGFRDIETVAGHVLVQRITTGMLRRDAPAVRDHVTETYRRRVVEVAALIEAGLIPADVRRRMGRAA